MRLQLGATSGVEMRAGQFRRQYRIRNPRRVAWWIDWLCWIAMATLALMAAISLFTLLQVYDLNHHHKGGLKAMLQARQYLLTISSLAVIELVCLMGFFLVWVYRVSTNAIAMGAVGLKFKPLAAVAALLVPPLNIVLAPLMMDELWRVALSTSKWREQKHHILVAVWWVFTLVAVIGGVLLSRTGRGDILIETWNILSWQVGYIAATMPLYIVIPAMVKRITDAQRKQLRVASRYRQPLVKAD